MANVVGINDVLKVTWDVAGLNNQTALPSVYYLVTNIAGSPTDQQLADKVDLVNTPNLLPLLNALAFYRGVIVQKISPLPVLMRVFNGASAAVGTGGPTPLPQQVSGLITWVTNLAGRAGRGRFYAPFPAQAAVNNITEHPTGAYNGNLAAWIAALLGNVNFGVVPNTANIQMVLFHRASRTTTSILNGVPRTRWATQRRRGDYGRENPSPF